MNNTDKVIPAEEYDERLRYINLAVEALKSVRNRRYAFAHELYFTLEKSSPLITRLNNRYNEYTEAIEYLEKVGEA